MPLATQGAALVIVTVAPDAVVLVRLQREGQAFGPDRQAAQTALARWISAMARPVFPIGKKNSGS